MTHHLWIAPLAALALAQLAAIATSIFLHRGSLIEPRSCTLSQTSVFGRSSGSPGARTAGNGWPSTASITHSLIRRAIPIAPDCRWTDVDRDAGAIRLRVEAAKTGRGRTVMLEGDLAELIDRRWQARLFEKGGNVRVAALVFHREGEPVGDFRKAWATACQAAGVPDKLFHDLRRTAARNMVRAGVPERVAMAVTGHLTRSMFDRYNIVSEDDLRMAAHKTTMYVDTLPTKREA